MYIQTAIWFIKLGVALTMVVFGINQMSHPENWLEFMPGFMKRSSFMKPKTSMRVHSLGNILFGLFLALPFAPLVSAWIAVIWWASIVPFAWKESWGVGLRDLSITCALAALVALLS